MTLNEKVEAGQRLLLNHAQALTDAEEKAWKSLAGYKFEMFGYWASKWVSLNKLDDVKRPNPFEAAVKLAQGGVENEGQS